jgi:hypothetical protein
MILNFSWKDRPKLKSLNDFSSWNVIGSKLKYHDFLEVCKESDYSAKTRGLIQGAVGVPVAVVSTCLFLGYFFLIVERQEFLESIARYLKLLQWLGVDDVTVLLTGPELFFLCFAAPFLLTLLLIVTIVHEFIHFIHLPKKGGGENVTFVVNPWGGAIEVFYHKVIFGRSQMLLISLSPFVYLSLVPSIICFFYFDIVLVVVSIVNAALSCIDIFSSAFILMTPKNSKYKQMRECIVYKC